MSPSRASSVTWRNIAVDTLETSMPHARPCVRAVVNLDTLTPADVVIGAAVGTNTEAIGEGERLWSTHAYGEGRYVFERQVTPGELASKLPWIVRIAPVTGVLHRSVIRQFRRGRAD